MKRIRNFLSIIISVVLVFASGALVLADSDSRINEENSNAKELLYCLRGQDAPEELLTELDDLDVDVSANTVLKVVRMRTQNRNAVNEITAELGPTVLMITNCTGRNVTTDIFMAIDTNGNFTSVLPEDGDLTVPRDGGTSYLPPDGSNLVKVTAVFNRVYESDDYLHWFPFYQPIGLLFTYYANGINSLTAAEVYYIAEGVEYTYPGFVMLNGGDLYDHVIYKSITNPVNNMIYHALNEYRTDRAMDVNSGGPFVGQTCTYYFTIDGRTIDGTVRIFDND